MKNSGSSFTPVPYECRETILEQIQPGKSGKVFYFTQDKKLDSAEGRIIAMQETPDGIFVSMEPAHLIRIDMIITVFGQTGAAYDEYAALGNSCMECHGGYDFD